MNERKGEILKKIKTVTSVPASALRAIKLLNDPNVNMGEVVQVIAYDPGLTSNILKLANSSYFGCARSISSLRDAVVRLGSANIFKLVTASIASLVLNKNIKGYNMTSGELWEHSIAVAVAAETSSYVLKLQDASKTAFTSGLLHDIGKVILGDFFDPQVEQEISVSLSKNKSFYEAEKEAFGINHAELGARLLNSWSIPDNLSNAVRWHHAPEFCRDSQCSTIVHFCDYICIKNKIGSQTEPLNMRLSEQAVAVLKISDKDNDEIIMRTRDSFENIKDIFSKPK
ncbi:MAG: hypothetical protein A2017_03245 [Lentisphaerae bacterium GWF2_44_16]|nr:MAG: hypothetical protein A2017_03245 [Lentisphaerae bacterium GWF2_44_16]